LTEEAYRNVVGPNLEDNLNFSQREDDHNFLKREDNPNFLRMEDDLIFFENGRQLQSLKMEDELNVEANGRRHQYFSLGNGGSPSYFGKWKTTSIIRKMNDHINIFSNGM
jgi:hypothetical protein